VPTFTTTPQFTRDVKALTADQRARFQKVVREEFVVDLAAGTGQFRPGLRVKKVQGVPKVFEMTWAPDGRATWQYGPEVREGVAHVVWRRVGTHAIFRDA
jgi:hypothetical protein